MIKFENVSLSFDGSYVLKDFSFDVKRGGKLILSGRSGIGKSSVFRLLLGFVKPDSGRILFMDKPLDHKYIWTVRRSIAYISQDLNIGFYTVKELFDAILSFKANSLAKETSQLDGLLEYFELDGCVLDKKIADLSGGEKQRIAIIQALLLNKKVFLLDEITSALDNKLKLKVMDYFFSRDDWTIICISHDNIELQQPGIRVINMEAQR